MTSGPLDVSDANWAALAATLTSAIDANVAYLADTTPTAAEQLAQIQALTRQVNALIRLRTGQLDTTDGT